MIPDNSISYEFAGKGAKRRRKQAIEPNARPKPRPYLRKPEAENRKAKKIEMSESYHTAQGVKARIRYLVIDHDMSYLDICETMKREGCPVTGVTIGNVRREISEVMRLLENEGLLNVDALARRRRKLKGRDRDD